MIIWSFPDTVQDTANAPAAAIQRVIACMMARLHGVIEFAVVKILPALVFPLFLLAGCAAESPEEKAATRLRQAEDTMEECKRRAGLEGTPTPDTTILDMAEQRGQPLTTEGANTVRLKVTCRRELEELIAAKQARAQPR